MTRRSAGLVALGAAIGILVSWPGSAEMVAAAPPSTILADAVAAASTAEVGARGGESEAAIARPASPAAAPAPAPAPGAAAAEPPPAPAPEGFANRLVGPGGLDAEVGTYADCSGRSPIPSAIAATFTCVGWSTYFVGHNPGVFTPLMSVGVGAMLTWWDGAGGIHPLRIVAVRDGANSDPSLRNPAPGTVAQFQTCLVPDGSRVRILDAAPA